MVRDNYYTETVLKTLVDASHTNVVFITLINCFITLANATESEKERFIYRNNCINNIWLKD